MKIALVTPSYYPFVRGNAVTVRRIEKNLQAQGCRVRVFPLDTATAEDTLKEIKAFDPDLLHAFHGYLGGRISRLISRNLDKPYIITLTGTDVYEALHDSRKEDTVSALAESSAIVVFHDSIKTRLLEDLPELEQKTSCISQAVEIPGRRYFHHHEFMPAEGDLIVILPAGLRPVKNVAFALPLLARLHEQGTRLYFVLIGPILNRGYAAEVLEEIERYPFAHYFGEVGHDAIGWFYEQADVVLNTSSFEGGMANTVLEAMHFGKAVLCSNIEGNRSVVEDGATGLLYKGDKEFLKQFERLAGDEQLRASLGRNARQFILNNFDPSAEAAAYINLYRVVLEGKAGAGSSDGGSCSECMA